MTLRECPDCQRWSSERAGDKCPDCGASFGQGSVALGERTKQETPPPSRTAAPQQQYKASGSVHNWEDDQKALKGSRKVAEKKRASDINPPARNEGFLMTLMVLLLLAAAVFFLFR